MSDGEVIQLYDIPGHCNPDGTWSPNVWKIRCGRPFAFDCVLPVVLN
jgi:hypothetical protein